MRSLREKNVKQLPSSLQLTYHCTSIEIFFLLHRRSFYIIRTTSYNLITGEGGGGSPLRTPDRRGEDKKLCRHAYRV